MIKLTIIDRASLYFSNSSPISGEVELDYDANNKLTLISATG